MLIEIKAPPPAAYSDAQKLKAARHLARCRPAGVPLPGMPQRKAKLVVKPGDYARPKRVVGRSPLRKSVSAASIGSSAAGAAAATRGPRKGQRVMRPRRHTLGPKGRKTEWPTKYDEPLRVSLLKYRYVSHVRIMAVKENNGSAVRKQR